MSGPPCRLRGSHRAAGLAWERDQAPRGARAWSALLHPGDRVVDLEGLEPGAPTVRMVRFQQPRRVQAGTGGADLVVPTAQGWTTLANPGTPKIGTLEFGQGGRRWLLRLPGRAAPTAALLDLELPPTTRLGAAGAPPAAPPAPPPDFGLITHRLGLHRAAPAASGSPSDPGSRSRLGDWLAAAGGSVLRELAALFPPGPRMARRVHRGRPLGPDPQAGPLSALLRGLARFLGDLGLAAGVVMAGIVGGLWSLLTGWLPRRGDRPRGPGPLRRAWARLLARMPDWSVLWALGARHGRLLQELADRFRHGDLLEALRHAVPLGGAGDAPPDGWFFGRLPRRAQLRLAQGGAGSKLAAGEQLVGLLQRMYRDAHRRLHDQGDTERAAWVLAELLRDKQGAVEYLEDQGRFRTAAEWAELLELPTATAARLWVRAGQGQRALDLAAQRGMLGTVLCMLETDGAEEAPALRRLWARRLWAAGAGHAAITVAWPLGRDGGLPLEAWVLREWSQERVLPRALAPALALGLVPRPHQALEAALGRGAAARDAVARGILSLSPDADQRVPASPGAGASGPQQAPGAGLAVPAPVRAETVRALLADLAEGSTIQAPMAATLVRALVAGATGGSLALLARDLPELGPGAPARPGRSLATGHHTLRIPVAAAPTPAPSDVWIDETGFLTAILDGSGIWTQLPGERGRCWPITADHLIPGGPLLVACRRDSTGVHHLWHLPAEAPPRPLGVLSPGACPVPQADEDGLIWTHGPDGICAWTPEEGCLRRVWTSGRAVGAVQGLEVSPTALRAITAVDGARELWRWDRTTGPTLRQRRPLRDAPVSRAPRSSAPAPRSVPTDWQVDVRSDSHRRLRSRGWQEPTDQGPRRELSFSGALADGPPTGRLRLAHSAGQLDLMLREPGDRTAPRFSGMRALPGPHLLLWRDGGQVISIDLHTPTLLSARSLS